MSPPPMGSPPFGSGERRATRRYDLSLPIVVCVVPHKRSEPCHGRIRDISARGIYFITNEEFTPGAELEFSIALPVGIAQRTEVSILARSQQGAARRREKRRRHHAHRRGCRYRKDCVHRRRTWPIVNPLVLNLGQYLCAKDLRGMEELKRHPPKKSLHNNLISGLLVVGSCLQLRSLPEA
jgi:hypothetical protein